MQLSRSEALKLYCSLIRQRIKNPIRKTEITEVHHIIPRSLCKSLVKNKYNLICMYSHEHWLAHYYLSVIFPHNTSVQRAFYLMSNRKKVKSFKSIKRFAKAYEHAKKQIHENRVHKTYAEIYGKTAAEKIKIKKKKKQINHMIRVIPY